MIGLAPIRRGKLRLAVIALALAALVALPATTAHAAAEWSLQNPLLERNDAGGTTGYNLTVVLAPAATTGELKGRVTAGGSPLGGVGVSGPYGRVTTSADGTYTISSLVPGNHIVSFSKAGYVFQQVLVTISAGVTTVQNVDLAVRSPIAVSVPKVSGTAKRGRTITVYGTLTPRHPPVTPSLWTFGVVVRVAYTYKSGRKTITVVKNVQVPVADSPSGSSYVLRYRLAKAKRTYAFKAYMDADRDHLASYYPSTVNKLKASRSIKVK
ncbi:MAG: carboxypeptidase-like regulatory domain-containing protein [Actinomycetes bacterium]